MKKLLPLLALALGASASAQSVIFPQEDQPGAARLIENGSTYTLANDLLEASFGLQDGRLLFGGCPQMDLLPGTELFYLTLGDGTSVPASAMTATELHAVTLTGDPEAVKGSDRFNGEALEATFTYGDLTVDWRALLRDGSHYLRTEMEISASSATAMRNIIGMTYTLSAEAPKAAPVGNTRGQVILSDKIFAGLETPTAYNTVGAQPVEVLTPEAGKTYGLRSKRGSRYVTEKADGSGLNGTEAMEGDNSVWSFEAREDGKYDVKNKATGSYLDNTAANNTQLTVTTTAPSQGWEIRSSSESGYIIIINENNCQLHQTNNAHQWKVFNWGSGNTSDEGCLYTLVEQPDAAEGEAQPLPMQGLWSRVTTLEPGKTWKVSSVVGLVAPDQARRSFLAYSERERALPWRPMVHYNSWYELNIDRNNSPTYDGHMTEAQCLEVVEQWRTNLFEKYDTSIEAFVWDDGWDEYGTWTFNKNFPNGFSKINDAAATMNAGIGTWLGPVGGYGNSGNLRRQYWNGKGGMQLSNPEYYNVFLGAVSRMTQDYDFRFFKLDGISTQWSSVGPDAGDTGNENAEGIIDVEQRVRDINPNIFFNTTVGTWASPFWYRYSDATWRQENDWSAIGNGSIDRQRWITYRDRLVYQNYVQNSPLCPINTLMTHGVILTTHGQVSTNMTYKHVLRELRCAFGCGSAMIELYCDFALLNSINDGKLWADIADCIKWQKKNAEVLPDIHWVGGNPWDGTESEVYGWGAWNGKNVSLTLRNPNASRRTFTLNLRKALDIPAYVNTPVVLSKAFEDIVDIDGLPMGEPLDLDKDYEITLKGYEVYMYDGAHSDVESSISDIPAGAANAPVRYYDLQGRRVENPTAGQVYVTSEGSKLRL